MTKRILRSISIVISFLLCFYIMEYHLAILNLTKDNIFEIILVYLFIAIIITVSIYFLHKLNIDGIITELGLNKGFSKGLLFGFVATLPMTMSSAILFKFSNNIFSFYTLFVVFIGPVMEEILFRGYLFGQLFRRERWGFIPASIIASIFFGIGHLYQSHNLLSAAETFLVTFMGSAWFAWLYIEHNTNLWVAIWLHVLMNLSWTIFQTNVPGAIGNNITNLFRLITIIITVIYTIRYSKKYGFKVNKRNLLINYSS